MKLIVALRSYANAHKIIYTLMYGIASTGPVLKKPILRESDFVETFMRYFRQV
jgi:hypothetical protein